jgi:peptidoglycan hydrolase-like protein with peptidoglycan-binding domain
LSRSSKDNTRTKKKIDISEAKKDKYIFNHNINFQDRNPEVVELQKRLKDEGFFTYPSFTEYYGPVTRKAVLDYQMANGVVHSPYDTGAGRLGPSTRAKLNN